MKDTTPQAVQVCHELLLWFIPQLGKFPRARRITLGERLETTLLVALLMVAAAFGKAKQTQRGNGLLREDGGELTRKFWSALYHEEHFIGALIHRHRRPSFLSRPSADLGPQVPAA